VTVVMLSYRRADASGHAGRLYDGLRASGTLDVFMDVDNIRPGDDFVAAIDSVLERCDVLLAVIGPTWLTVTDSHGRRRLDSAGDHVRLELASALARRDVRVIPVLVGGAAMPEADDLPADLQPLQRRHAVTIRDEYWGRDLEMLRAELARLGMAPPVLPTAAPQAGGMPVDVDQAVVDDSISVNPDADAPERDAAEPPAEPEPPVEAEVERPADPDPASAALPAADAEAPAVLAPDTPVEAETPAQEPPSEPVVPAELSEPAAGPAVPADLREPEIAAAADVAELPDEVEAPRSGADEATVDRSDGAAEPPVGFDWRSRRVLAIAAVVAIAVVALVVVLATRGSSLDSQLLKAGKAWGGTDCRKVDSDIKGISCSVPLGAASPLYVQHERITGDTPVDTRNGWTLTKDPHAGANYAAYYWDDGSTYLSFFAQPKDEAPFLAWWHEHVPEPAA
jgi:hypothetical protein